MSLSVAGRKTGAAAVEFARELADKAARFAAEVERLHAQAHDWRQRGLHGLPEPQGW